MFESSDGKRRAQALPSRLFTNSLPLTPGAISQSKLERSERCWQSEALLPLQKQWSNETKIMILYDQYTCRHIGLNLVLEWYVTLYWKKANDKNLVLENVATPNTRYGWIWRTKTGWKSTKNCQYRVLPFPVYVPVYSYRDKLSPVVTLSISLEKQSLVKVWI